MSPMLDLKVGYTCNNRCLHCIVVKNRDHLFRAGVPTDLTTTEILSIIKDAHSAGITGVVLTGGEVSIRPDYPVILDRLMSLGFNIIIQTNGRQVARPDVLGLISSYPKIHLVIALHGDTADLHDRISGRNGSFFETLASVDTLHSLGKDLILKVVISRHNQDRLVDIAKLANLHGFRHFSYAFPHVEGGALEDRIQDIPTYTSVMPSLKDLVKYVKNSSFILELEAFPFCTIVDFFEYVIEMPGQPMGEKLVLPVRQQIQDWAVLRPANKIKLPQCARCIFSNVCEGPWRDYPRYFGHQEFKPVSFDPKIVEKLIVCLASRNAKHNQRQGFQPKKSKNKEKGEIRCQRNPELLCPDTSSSYLRIKSSGKGILEK